MRVCSDAAVAERLDARFPFGATELAAEANDVAGNEEATAFALDDGGDERLARAAAQHFDADGVAVLLLAQTAAEIDG